MRALKLRLVAFVVLASLLASGAALVSAWAAAATFPALAVLGYVVARGVANDLARLEERRAELAAERSRVEDAIERFRGALAATQDPFSVLAVMVESAVEATRAAGGQLLLDGAEVASAGNLSANSLRLAIPLESEEAALVLTPPAGDFDEEARRLAQRLASEAAIAVENARLHRRLEKQAVTDGLTDLPNRRQFEHSLASEIERVDRFGGTLSLVLADLDDFKQVNDRYGHLAGDDVLRAFADMLEENVRAIDLASRYGGEEFAILLPQTDLAGAERVAERLRRGLSRRPIKTAAGALVAVTASFGVASYPFAPTQAALFAAADEALYDAKAAGKNRVVASALDAAEAASSRGVHRTA